jgi:hypothetical protein
MTTFLFDVASLTQLTLARETARRARDGGYAVAISFSGDDQAPACEAARQTASELGASFFVMAQYERDVPEAAFAPPPPFKPTLLDRMREVVFPFSAPLAVPPSESFEIWRKIVGRQQAAAARILAESSARTVIVGEDGVSGNAALIAAAREADVPVIVCPYGFGSRGDFRNNLQEKHREGRLLILGESPSERLLAKRRPQWICRTEHGNAVMFPPHMILAREAAGWSMPDPWTPLGGGADYIAVESQAAREHYRREGIPAEKLVDLGSPYCDVLADTLAAHPDCDSAYRGSTKINAGRTRILISLPPSYHVTRPNTSEFADYAGMCRAVVEACRRVPNAECTLSIHPATQSDQRAMLARLGAKMADEWVLRLIPRHDIFLTSFSSTPRWAIACGKPVLNYDAYQFRLSIFDGAPAVKTTVRLAEVESELARLSDDAEFHRTAAALAADRGRWGLLDGGNTKRVLEFASRVTQRKKKSALKRSWNISASYPETCVPNAKAA